MDKVEESIKQSILNCKTSLGIEMGSTRIKAVLIDDNNRPIATGGHDWENELCDGIWIYRLENVWTGLQACFRSLSDKIMNRFGIRLRRVGAIGISGMMHGYIVLNSKGEQLAPFRTWRNTNSERAAGILTKEFAFNIPIRWTIAQLYQSVLEDMEHVRDIDFLSTLSGYVHWCLTGKKVVGIGEASGIFPVDTNSLNYNSKMIMQFDELVRDKNYSWKLIDIMPKVLIAGEAAGELTPEGALLLDPTGGLESGIPMCPPEGDAGTGMVATNSITEHTGNVSAGTSSFAMVVLDKDFDEPIREIDIINTPVGKQVAMVHCNNCTTDLDAWVRIFKESIESMGFHFKKSELYDMLYNKAIDADVDCGKLLAYNYVSGEPVTNINEGRPLFIRAADSRFTLANFMRTMLFSTIASLRVGMDILEQKQVTLEQITGHGGYFKTEKVGQRFMAAALRVPVVVLESAGEGGAWGIALLASYMRNKEKGEELEDFLENKVFMESGGLKIEPRKEDIKSFELFMEQYKRGLELENKAAQVI